MSIPVVIFLILCSVGILAILSFLIFNSIGFFTGAPYAPSPSLIVDKIIDLAQVTQRDIVYDLGSGDGRVLIGVAKKGATAIGWEINYPLYAWSIRSIKQSRLGGKVTVHFGNFWNKSFSGATVVFAFLLPQSMAKLEAKLRREVPPKTRVVTYLAKLPTYKPYKETPDGLTLYIF